MREILGKLVNASGYEVLRNRYGFLKTLLKKLPIDHLIDVGANRSEFLRMCRSAGYVGAATAIEPISEYRFQLEQIQNVKVWSIAVGKIRKSMDLKIYSSSDFSSFHTLNDRYLRKYGKAPTVKDVRRIEVLTLDELDISGANILLKVDVQGAEADVLKGGTQTLKRVGVLWLELPFMGIYDGGCSVAELFSITEAEGLIPARFFANSIAQFGGWVDGDAVFIRLPEGRGLT
jgi:FkbM family methyltransferase